MKMVETRRSDGVSIPNNSTATFFPTLMAASETDANKHNPNMATHPNVPGLILPHFVQPTYSASYSASYSLPLRRKAHLPHCGKWQTLRNHSFTYYSFNTSKFTTFSL
mmetsp:Transcript_4457/g.12491  ORF Transcript_4457/g.12491 Transcript_4457/m.12491 type:complete len:108 (+) Transcript_4457:959-1282(+)